MVTGGAICALATPANASDSVMAAIVDIFIWSFPELVLELPGTLSPSAAVLKTCAPPSRLPRRPGPFDLKCGNG
jgi:hypothetical protein